MNSSIQKLINFFKIPGNRCKGDYNRGNRFCILGALSALLGNEENRETKKHLESRLEKFIAAHKIDINLNLATFNDAATDDQVLLFLEGAKGF